MSLAGFHHSYCCERTQSHVCDALGHGRTCREADRSLCIFNMDFANFSDPLRRRFPISSDSSDESTLNPTREQTTTEDIRPATLQNLSQANDEKTCRICLLTEEDSDESLGRLFSPCLCKGTMKYVHEECLNRWRLINHRKMYQCGTCGYKYNFRRTSFAKVVTNELALTVITLSLFAFLVFITGFIVKLLIKFFMELDPTITLDESTGLTSGLTYRDVFTVDYAHMLMGFFGVGIVGFVQLMFTIFFLGPFPQFSPWRLSRLSTSNTRTNRDGGTGMAILIIILVLGSLKLLWGMYKSVKLRLKTGLQEVILEVNE